MQRPSITPLRTRPRRPLAAQYLMDMRDASRDHGELYLIHRTANTSWNGNPESSIGENTCFATR